jgi:two-component system response regulator NreC
MVRRSLRLLLEHEEGIEMIADVDNLASALRHVDDSGHGCVVVVDWRMAGACGRETDRKLHDPNRDIPIVILSMEDSAAFAQRAFAWGALGFVLKDRADNELPQAVRAVARAEEYVSPRVAERLLALRRPLARD